VKDEKNVWASGDGQQEGKDSPVRSESETKAMPKVMDLFTDLMVDLFKTPLAYLYPGIPLFVLWAVVMVVMIVTIGGGVAAGILWEQQTVMIAGIVIGELALLAAIPIFIVLQVGAVRAMWVHISGEQTLTVSLAWMAMRSNMKTTIVYAAIQTGMAFVAALFCYFPAIIVLAVLSFGPAVLAIEQCTGWEAIKRTVQLARSHPGYHFRVACLSFLVGMICGQIPLLGIAVAPGVVGAIHLMAYTRAYGSTVDP